MHKHGKASWEKSLSLTQTALDTPLSRRSVEYNTVSGTEQICHSDGTPPGFIVGLLVVPFTFSDIGCFSVSRGVCRGFAKVYLQQNKTLPCLCNVAFVYRFFLFSVFW